MVRSEARNALTTKERRDINATNIDGHNAIDFPLAPRMLRAPLGRRSDLGRLAAERQHTQVGRLHGLKGTLTCIFVP
jgi:hypothetical protein